MAKPPEKPRDRSWLAVGIDTSLTALSVVALGYDAVLDKMAEPTWGEIRWTPEVDYFERLRQAAKGHELLLDVMARQPVVNLDNVHIAIEEPFPLGMAGKTAFKSAWIKQQSQVSGSLIGALVRYGFVNIYEINVSQWRAVVRKDGVALPTGLEGKMAVKKWAIKAFGLPDLPDLVKGKGGGKIPRPESGFGAKAKAEQPDDLYDAAGCLAWMCDQLVEWEIAN